jgi:GAF domain-containing protein
MSGDDEPTRLRALLAEQAALRRVATMVVGSTPPPALFDRVCEELGGLLAVKSTDMIRFEGERFARVVGAWASAPGRRAARRRSQSASASRSRARR